MISFMDFPKTAIKIKLIPVSMNKQILLAFYFKCIEKIDFMKGNYDTSMNVVELLFIFSIVTANRICCGEKIKKR